MYGILVTAGIEVSKIFARDILNMKRRLISKKLNIFLVLYHLVQKFQQTNFFLWKHLLHYKILFCVVRSGRQEMGGTVLWNRAVMSTVSVDVGGE